MDTVLQSRSKTMTIGRGRPFCIIGERINPTGRKSFAEELRAGELSTVATDAIAQVDAGADMLDVNAGIPLVDEAELLGKMLRTVQQAVDVPICIDSSVIEALEAGLSVYEGRALVNSVTAEDERPEEMLPLVIDSSIIEVLDAGLAAYQGKALVNSVTAEDERMEAILPIVKKYGAAVIGLPNDEEEIPEEPDRRLELVRKLIHVATEKYKIGVEDIVIDPLAMPVGADTLHPTRTIDTIAMIKAEFGVNMTLGASNVSFGMPDRHSIAATFLPIAISHGLTSAIMDARAPQIVRAVKAADLVLNRDEWGANWIAAHRAQQKAAEAAKAQVQGAT